MYKRARKRIKSRTFLFEQGISLCMNGLLALWRLWNDFGQALLNEFQKNAPISQRHSH